MLNCIQASPRMRLLQRLLAAHLRRLGDNWYAKGVPGGATSGRLRDPPPTSSRRAAGSLGLVCMGF